MKNSNFLLIACFIIVLTVLGCNPKPPSSQSFNTKAPVSKELYDEIAKMDSVMFEAFNAHDADRLQTYFSEDLEFYHDKDGLADFSHTMASFRGLFERNKNTGLRRDLVKGSLEVYPLNNYGAVEVCLHRFCHKENGKDDCGVFKNIMIWQNKNGQWKVTRVISYDH
jgi:hypothetical protein